MATTQAKVGVLILLLIGAAAAVNDPYGHYHGCYYAVHIRGAPAAAKDTWFLFTLLRYDGIMLWKSRGSAKFYGRYTGRSRRFRPSRRFRMSPPNFIFYTDKFCQDPCHLKLKVEDPGLDHLLPLSVGIKAMRDKKGDRLDYDDPEFVRLFNPVLPTNPLVPGEADMDMCNDKGCRYVVTVQTAPAAVDTSFVQFNVSNKAGQLLWSDWEDVESEAGVSSSFRFTSETPGTRCQDPCHLKLKADHDHSGSSRLLLLPLFVSIRAIETHKNNKKFARNFAPTVPKIDPTKKPALVLDQADMDLCNIPSK